MNIVNTRIMVYEIKWVRKITDDGVDILGSFSASFAWQTLHKT